MFHAFMDRNDNKYFFSKNLIPCVIKCEFCAFHFSQTFVRLPYTYRTLKLKKKSCMNQKKVFTGSIFYVVVMCTRYVLFN